MKWKGEISESEQKERKIFLFRFLKEHGIFNVFRDKFDSNFFHMYVSTSETSGRLKDFDDYLKFFLNSNYFSPIITYAFIWKHCGWPNDNENECQSYWEKIAHEFAKEAQEKYDKL